MAILTFRGNSMTWKFIKIPYKIKFLEIGDKVHFFPRATAFAPQCFLGIAENR